jgi:hypothetical protein
MKSKLLAAAESAMSTLKSTTAPPHIGSGSDRDDARRQAVNAAASGRWLRHPRPWLRRRREWSP